MNIFKKISNLGLLFVNHRHHHLLHNHLLLHLHNHFHLHPHNHFHHHHHHSHNHIHHHPHNHIHHHLRNYFHLHYHFQHHLRLSNQAMNKFQEQNIVSEAQVTLEVLFLLQEKLTLVENLLFKVMLVSGVNSLQINQVFHQRAFPILYFRLLHRHLYFTKIIDHCLHNYLFLNYCSIKNRILQYSFFSTEHLKLHNYFVHRAIFKNIFPLENFFLLSNLHNLMNLYLQTYFLFRQILFEGCLLCKQKLHIVNIKLYHLFLYKLFFYIIYIYEYVYNIYQCKKVKDMLEVKQLPDNIKFFI